LDCHTDGNLLRASACFRSTAISGPFLGVFLLARGLLVSRRVGVRSYLTSFNFPALEMNPFDNHGLRYLVFTLRL